MRRIIAQIWLTLLVGTALPVSLAAKEGDDVTLKIPSKYRGGTFRISSETHKPVGGKITLKGQKGVRRRVEILDKNGRILSDTFGMLRASSISKTHARYFRFGPAIGLTFVEPKATKKLFIDNTMFHTGAELIFQPSTFGLMAGYSRADGKCRTTDRVTGLCSGLEREVFRLGLSTEFALLKNAPLFFSRIHTSFKLGASYAENKIRFGDDFYKVNDSDNNFGGFASAELRKPIGLNFWWFLRAGYMYHRLKFEKLNYDEDFHQYNYSVGARYAL